MNILHIETSGRSHRDREMSGTTEEGSEDEDYEDDETEGEHDDSDDDVEEDEDLSEYEADDDEVDKKDAEKDHSIFFSDTEYEYYLDDGTVISKSDLKRALDSGGKLVLAKNLKKRKRRRKDKDKKAGPKGLPQVAVSP